MLDLKMYRMFAFENRQIETYIGNMACQQVRGGGVSIEHRSPSSSTLAESRTGNKTSTCKSTCKLCNGA